MKIKLSLVALLVIALAYTSCKKSSDNGPALSAQQVSTQVATNLADMLYSGFGAFSIGDGLNAPGTVGVIKTKNGLKVNDDGDPLCGTIADTTFNYSTTADGVSASVKGTLKFAFSCTAGVYTGFNITDNLNVAESSSSLSVNYNLIEDLTLAAVNPDSDDSNASLNGSLSLGGSYTNKSGSKGSGTTNYSYTFTSIILDGETGNIDSGTATFKTSGTGPNGSWNYSGTVTFLGNNQAKIVINGASYTVTLPATT